MILDHILQFQLAQHKGSPAAQVFCPHPGQQNHHSVSGAPQVVAGKLTDLGTQLLATPPLAALAGHLFVHGASQRAKTLSAKSSPLCTCSLLPTPQRTLSLWGQSEVIASITNGCWAWASGKWQMVANHGGKEGTGREIGFWRRQGTGVMMGSF
jgi:hypothetical protein